MLWLGECQRCAVVSCWIRDSELQLQWKTSRCSLWYSVAALAWGARDGRGRSPGSALSPSGDQPATLSDHWHHVSQRWQMWPLSSLAAARTESSLTGSRRGRGWRTGLSSKGLWLLRIYIEVRSLYPTTNNLTRLGNEGAAAGLVHSTFHLKKDLSDRELRSATLRTWVSQKYSQKTNNLSVSEIG